MKIVTANLNGIRSAYQKGFFEWIAEIKPEIVCLQEIKADLADIPLQLQKFGDYYCYYHPAQKKGYSGVAIMSLIKPVDVVVGLGNAEIDNEGRYIELVFANDLHVASLYLPSGSSGEDKQQKKFRALDYYLPILRKQIQNQKFIIGGDWNIAHQEIDLKNWKNNLNNSGFLPEERQWLGSVLNCGYVDSYRHLYPDDPGYTWWSNRGRAYANNVGWRIDYQMVSHQLVHLLKRAEVFKSVKFSDHAPLIVDYDMQIMLSY